MTNKCRCGQDWEACINCFEEIPLPTKSAQPTVPVGRAEALPPVPTAEPPKRPHPFLSGETDG